MPYRFHQTRSLQTEARNLDVTKARIRSAVLRTGAQSRNEPVKSLTDRFFVWHSIFEFISIDRGDALGLTCEFVVLKACVDVDVKILHWELTKIHSR